jgi:hypothetical protein
MPIPVIQFAAGAQLIYRTPAWFRPRSRRSACFPAEAYPPPRSLVVYLELQFRATDERKKSLIIAALSDMLHIGPISGLPARAF